MAKWKYLGFYLLPPFLLLAIFLTVNLKTDLSAFIIAGENSEEVLLASEMQSGKLSRRYLISVAATEGKNVADDFIEIFQKELQSIRSVNNVWSSRNKNDIYQTIKTFYPKYSAGIFSLKPEPYLANLFSEHGFEKQAILLKQLLLSPQSGVFKPIVIHDPLLLTLSGFEGIKSGSHENMVHDQAYQNLILETTAPGLDANQQSRIQSDIYKLFKQLVLEQSKNYKLEMTGVPVFATATQKLIQGDIIKISLISSVLLVVLFLLVFRSFSVLFNVFTILITVILSAILITNIVFGYVHGMTIAIGSTLVGICIDFPIHALAHSQAVKPNQRALVISRIWPSMLLGGVTTMIGYIALGFSGYPGFQQVAVFSGSGILISLLMTRFILPHLNAKKNSHKFSFPFVIPWMQFCRRNRSLLVMLLVLILVISSFGLQSIRWLSDMQELTPELNYLKSNDQRIRARMTSIEPGRFVLVKGDTVEDALQNSEKVYSLLEQLKSRGELSSYFGLYPWLLSIQKQEQNQLLLRNHLTDINISNWKKALKAQGLSVSHLGSLEYSNKSTFALDQVLRTPVSKLIDGHIIIGNNQALVMIWLAKHNPEAIKLALASVESANYFSQREMLNNMTVEYMTRAKSLLTMGLVIIGFLLLFRYKNVRITIQTLMPAVLAAFIILAVWSYAGEAISFLHLVGFLLVVAICVDYGIFYQENRSGDLSLTYQAMAASMCTSSVAFGSMLLADSTALRLLSGVVACGVILGFLLCPLVIRGSLIDDK